MLSFPALLGRTTSLCNRLGSAIAYGTVVFGLLTIAVQIGQWRTVLVPVGNILREFSSEQEYAAIVAKTENLRYGPEGLQEQVARGLELLDKKATAMEPDKRELYLAALLDRVSRELLPVVAGFTFLLLLVHGAARAFFLTVAGRRIGGFSAALPEALRVLLPLMGVWIAVGVCSLLWLAFAFLMLGVVWPQGFIVGILLLVASAWLYPRLALAPAILAEEGRGILESLRLSFERTRGRWGYVVLNLLGIGAMMWMVTTIAEGAVGQLASMVLTRSPFGVFLYWLLPLLLVLKTAYDMAFNIELSRSLHHKAHAEVVA